MRSESVGATLGRLAVCCSLLLLGAAPAAFADELRAPVVAKKKIATGQTQTLNPQPIPPGKAAGVTHRPKAGGEQSIIFVGGKTVKSNRSNARSSVPAGEKRRAVTTAPKPVHPDPCTQYFPCLPH